MSEANDRRIEDATPDTDVTGVEKVPVSDGGTAKCLTVQQIVDFAAESFSQITEEETLDIANDGVYMKTGGAFVPVSASKLAEAVLLTLYAPPESASALSDDYVAVRRNGVAAKVKLSAIAELIGGGSSTSEFDIHELQSYFETGIGKADEFAVSVDFGASGYGMRRVRFKDILDSIVSLVGDSISQSSSSIGQNDYVLVARETTDGDGVTHVSIVRTKLSQSGIGQGDVKGPLFNSDGKIPTWNGANSKTLKDGLTLVVPSSADSGISAQSSTTEVPSAASTFAFVNGGYAKLPSVLQDSSGKIPKWDGNGGKLSQGMSVKDSVSDAPDNSSLLTEKAVVDFASDVVRSTDEAQTSGAVKVANWVTVDGENRLGEGVTVRVVSGDPEPVLTTEHRLSEAIKFNNGTIRRVDFEEDLRTVDESCPNAMVAVCEDSPSFIYFRNSGTSTAWYKVQGTLVEFT